MGLVRRGTLNWEGGQKTAETAVSLGATAFRRGAAIWRSMRLQVDQGRAPAMRPQHLGWADGRRLRATAAGRRRGYSSGERPAARSAGTAALVATLLVLAVAVGSFVSASAAWLKYASDLPDAHSIALASLPQDSIIYDSSGGVTLADIHREGSPHYDQHLTEMGGLAPQATSRIEDAKVDSNP